MSRNFYLALVGGFQFVLNVILKELKAFILPHQYQIFIHAFLNIRLKELKAFILPHQLAKRNRSPYDSIFREG
jgi:hypothetical protein